MHIAQTPVTIASKSQFKVTKPIEVDTILQKMTGTKVGSDYRNSDFIDCIGSLGQLAYDQFGQF